MAVAAAPTQLRLQQQAAPSRILSPGPPVFLRRPCDVSSLGPGLGRGRGPGRRPPSFSGFFSTSSIFIGRPPLGRGGGPGPAASKFTMRVASTKQAYICRDCGYIYSDRTPFDKLPDGYFCPVCGAPKRRFKVYEPAVGKGANDADVRKARKAQIKRDEAMGQALPIAIVIGVAALGGLYLYLNTNF
ncbi:hypothetical protein Dimus_004223 [Dionaea muscipula]